MSDATPDAADAVRRSAKAAALLLLLAAAVVLVWYAIPILLLLFAGVLFGVLFAGMADLIRRHGRAPDGLALAAAVLFVAAVLIAAGTLIGPRVAEQFSEFNRSLPETVRRLEDRVLAQPWARPVFGESLSLSDVPEGMDLWSRAAGAAGRLLRALGAAAVVVFVGVFLAADPRLYISGLLKLLPPQHRPRARETLAILGHQLRWWLIGQFASMAIAGVLMGLGLWLIGMPMALTLGVLLGLMEFVPYVGPWVAYVPIAAVSLSEGTGMFLWASALFLAVQVLESYVILPLVLQKAVELPPALTVAAVLLMGYTAGVPGALVATPLLVVAVVLVQRWYVEGTLREPVRIPGQARAE